MGIENRTLGDEPQVGARIKRIGPEITLRLEPDVARRARDDVAADVQAQRRADRVVGIRKRADAAVGRF